MTEVRPVEVPGAADGADDFSTRFAARVDAACARILASVGLDPVAPDIGETVDPGSDEALGPHWQYVTVYLEMLLADDVPDERLSAALHETLPARGAGGAARRGTGGLATEADRPDGLV